MEDVAYRKRTLDYRKKDAGAPFPVVWVQTFGPATPEISELIKKANVTLAEVVKVLERYRKASRYC